MDTIQAKLARAEKIVSETRYLRDLQKQYFKYRDDKTLRSAKVQERKVDDMISDYYRGTTQSLLGD